MADWALGFQPVIGINSETDSGYALYIGVDVWVGVTATIPVTRTTTATCGELLWNEPKIWL